MKGIVLDAGALVALERNDRRLWAVLSVAGGDEIDVIVPSTVLAQVWRGSARQARLGAALRYCVIAPFDPVARDVGELCGKARTRDIADAHVALVTAARADVVYTSDAGDIRRLLAALSHRQARVISC